jgi:hypothetical protein
VRGPSESTALVASTRDGSARLSEQPVGVASLPMTVSARRNARLRALALAAIPFVLFVVAAVPRVWAPDLVPFGDRQAAYVSEAFRLAPVSLATFYLDPSVPLLALVDPMLRAWPWPVETWVVLRGLLDAIGVSLLYLAARSAVGVWPGIMAAALYAANPLAWGAGRDPAGALGALLAAAVLLAAVRFVRHRSVPRGVILGAVLLLLGLPAIFRTGFDRHDIVPSLVGRTVPSLLTILFSLVPFLLTLPFLTTRVWVRWGGVAATVVLCLAVIGAVAGPDRGTSQPGPYATLREWSALERAVRETAGRTGVHEVTIQDEAQSGLLAKPLQALLRGDVRVRTVSTSALLPLEREGVFLLYPPDARRSAELQPASSLMHVIGPDGTDTGARVATLRPRPMADWLARVDRVEDGAFADDSTLLGVKAQPGADGGTDIALYWQLPVAAGQALGARCVVGRAGAPSSDDIGTELPPVDDRRGGEIVVQSVHLRPGADGQQAGAVHVTLYDDAGTIVRTAAGGVSLDVPLGSAPR